MCTVQEWFQAAKDGDVQKLRQNIQKFKCAQDFDGGDGKTALILNAVEQDVNQFKGKKNDNNQTALQFAVINNKQSVVEFLSQYECGLVDCDGWSALHHACKLGYWQCVKPLLSEHQLKTKDGKLPIQIAKENKSQQCSEIIEDFYKNSLLIQNEVDWFLASEYGNLNAVKQVVNQFKGKKNDNNQTALQIAVINNKQSVVEFLSQYECGLVDDDGWSALHHACKLGYWQCVMPLLSEYQIKTKDGKTALQIDVKINAEECKEILEIHQRFVQNKLKQDDWFLASKYGNLDIVKQVVQQFKGKKHISNQTALTIAVINNQKNIVEFLSHYECGSVDNDGKTALIHSVLNNRWEFIQFLQTELKIKDKSGQTALIYACVNKNVECIQYLLRESVIPNKQGKFPLQICQELGLIEGAKMIESYQKYEEFNIKNGNDWLVAAMCGYVKALKQNYKKYQHIRTIEKESALMLAAKYNYEASIEFLAPLEMYMTDINGRSALMHAAAQNSFSCIPTLLKEVAMIDNSGNCALHYACVNNCAEAVKLLLDESEIKNYNGKSALQIAQELKHTQCAELISSYQQIIINKHVTLKAKDKDGKTALIQVAILNKPEYIPQLKEELRAQDNQGKTALHYSCYYGYIECAKQLLEESCITDFNGLSALQVALNERHPECAKLIEGYFLDKSAEVLVLKAKNEALQMKTEELEVQDELLEVKAVQLEKQLQEKDACLQMNIQQQKFLKEKIVQETTFMKMIQDCMGYQ